MFDLIWLGVGGDCLGGSEGGDGDVMLVMSVMGVWCYFGIVVDVGVVFEMRVWSGNSCIRGGSFFDDD